MYDGNFWNGGCLNPGHGHPVPYKFEDHIRANVDLAVRIHAKYPRVLIEMHDMIAGGSPRPPENVPASVSRETKILFFSGIRSR